METLCPRGQQGPRGCLVGPGTRPPFGASKRKPNTSLHSNVPCPCPARLFAGLGPTAENREILQRDWKMLPPPAPPPHQSPWRLGPGLAKAARGPGSRAPGRPGSRAAGEDAGLGRPALPFPGPREPALPVLEHGCRRGHAPNGARGARGTAGWASQAQAPCRAPLSLPRPLWRCAGGRGRGPEGSPGPTGPQALPATPGPQAQRAPHARGLKAVLKSIPLGGTVAPQMWPPRRARPLPPPFVGRKTARPSPRSRFLLPSGVGSTGVLGELAGRPLGFQWGVTAYLQGHGKPHRPLGIPLHMSPGVPGHPCREQGPCNVCTAARLDSPRGLLGNQPQLSRGHPLGHRWRWHVARGPGIWP